MKRIFGARKEVAPPPTLDEASDKLTSRGDNLDDKIRKLDEQLVKHKDTIKKCRPGPAQDAAKRRALSVLKQKRMYEGQREQLYSQQFNMEQTTFALQSMQDSVHTVKAMKAAGKELKAAMGHKELNIDSIEKMQDEMADLMDMQAQIQDVMGQNFAIPDDLDEEDLMGELDALEADMQFETDNPNTEGVPSYLQEPDLPEAPTGLPQAHGQAEGPQRVDAFGLPAVPQRT